MPSAPFPERPDSARLFARNGVIEAGLSISRLPRFARCLQDTQGEVSVNLVFGHDSEGRRSLQGTLEVPARVQCQRCLQAMELPLRAELNLLVVDDEATREALEATRAGHAEIARQAEIIVDEHDDLDVLALIEDELLLSLPTVPMHAEQGCSPVLNRLRQNAEAGHSETAHPFAALAALRKADTGNGGNDE